MVLKPLINKMHQLQHVKNDILGHKHQKQGVIKLNYHKIGLE